MANLKELLKKHQLVAYFILTYALTWLLLLTFQPLYLAGQCLTAFFLCLGIFAPALVSMGLSALISPGREPGSRRPALICFFLVWPLAAGVITLYLVFYEKMVFSPVLQLICVLNGLLPAFLLSAAFSRVKGVKSLLRTCFKPEGSIFYYLLALLFFPGIWIVGNLLSRLLGMGLSFSNHPEGKFTLFLMAVLYYLYNFIFGGLSEEPGWRGFALLRLQARLSPLLSGLVLGVLWALWHAPLKFGGMDTNSLAGTLVEWGLIVLMSVLFTWFYNRTRGSVLVTVLLHPAMNMTGSFLSATLGSFVLLFVFLIFVIVLDRMWKKLPPDNPAVYQESRQETV